MAENQQIQDQSDLLQEVIESIAIPITGKVRLVTGKNQVSEESLLEFMNEQDSRDQRYSRFVEC